MKPKKTFSQLDYYWMLIDQFKDQLTVILVLNLLLFFVANHWSYLVSEVYLYASHKDIFKVFREQFVLNTFFETLAYTYLSALFVHLGTYKLNKMWIFRFNALSLVIVSTYFWTIPSVQSIGLILEKLHPFFIAVMVGQFMLYLIVGNEFFRVIKNKIKQPKINHS